MRQRPLGTGNSVPSGSLEVLSLRQKTFPKNSQQIGRRQTLEAHWHLVSPLETPFDRTELNCRA